MSYGGGGGIWVFPEHSMLSSSDICKLPIEVFMYHNYITNFPLDALIKMCFLSFEVSLVVMC